MYQTHLVFRCEVGNKANISKNLFEVFQVFDAIIFGVAISGQYFLLKPICEFMAEHDLLNSDVFMKVLSNHSLKIEISGRLLFDSDTCWTCFSGTLLLLFLLLR